jgi:hypothetical protein
MRLVQAEEPCAGNPPARFCEGLGINHADRNDVAPPGNQAATEKTNLDLHMEVTGLLDWT